MKIKPQRFTGVIVKVITYFRLQAWNFYYQKRKRKGKIDSLQVENNFRLQECNLQTAP